MTFFPNRQRIVLERHQLGLTLVHISKTNFYQKMVKVIKNTFVFALVAWKRELL